ncbi:MAG: carbohydrate-binding domain-containing protein [Paludibacteraceae bacterium]|nr:carbohydrate-binding domain-containing protein [Paludibacteraceae bacterium]
MKCKGCHLMAVLLLGMVACEKPPVINIIIPEEKQSSPVSDFNYTIATADSILNNTEDLVGNTEFDEHEVVITFTGSTVSVNNPHNSDGVSVQKNNNMVECRSTAEKRIAYRISGSGSGQIKIFSDQKVKLTLDHLNLSNANGPAISLQGEKRQFIVLDGDNVLSGCGTNEETDQEQAKGAFFSEGKIIVSGDGSLTIHTTGKHGLVSDEYIRIQSGNLRVFANESTKCKDGVHGKKGFAMDGGTLYIESYDEGIQAGTENTHGFCYIAGGEISISAKTGDGIQSTGDLSIFGGSLSVTSLKNEGIEGKRDILIEDGSIEITANDDGINAGRLITINGGRIYAQAFKNDAIDSNGDFVINGGIIVAIAGPTPETALDADQGTLQINGGTVVGIGDRSFMFVYPTPESLQLSIWSDVASGTSYNIQNESNEDALNFEIPPTTYYPRILISSPLFIEGENTLNQGVGFSGGENWHGLHLGATHSEATTSRTVKAEYGKLKAK